VALACGAALATSATAQSGRENLTPTDFERARVVALAGSVLRIEVRRAQGGYAFGSGVVVAPDRIVTNCHVTRDAAAVNVLRGDARWRAQAQVARPDLDICLLHVPGMIGTPVTIAERAPAKDQALTAYGFVAGAPQPSISTGRVLAAYSHADGEVLRTSASFTSGASGGALFGDDGALVGLLTFRMRGGDFYAAPTAWIKPLLSAAAVEVAPLRPLQLAYWEEASERQPRFLQALALEQRSAWGELRAMAKEWMQQSPGDVHAKRWHDLALQGQCRMQPAPGCP
jgi:serine protease Do